MISQPPEPAALSGDEQNMRRQSASDNVRGSQPLSHRFRCFATRLQQVLFSHAADCAAAPALDQFSRLHLGERKPLSRPALLALNFKLSESSTAASRCFQITPTTWPTEREFQDDLSPTAGMVPAGEDVAYHRALSAGAYRASELDKEHYHLIVEGSGNVVRGTRLPTT